MCHNIYWDTYHHIYWDTYHNTYWDMYHHIYWDMYHHIYSIIFSKYCLLHSSSLRNSWYYTTKCSAICITYHDDHIKISIVSWERDTCIVAAALLSIVNISGKNSFHKDLFCVMVSHTKMLDYLTHWGREKWTPFHRQHFQMYFLQWKCLNSDSNFTEVCSLMSN